MKSRPFGNKDFHVSEIGFGTWTMGGMWGPREDRTAIDALVLALENGVNFIDTAYAYGNGHSESLVASALRESKQKAFVATKIPPKNHEWPARHDVSITEIFPMDHVLEYTEKSLKNLRTDCIDLQQFHVWSDTWMDDMSWLDGIERLKSQGKIQYFGVSINDHEPETALKIVASGLVDSVQVIYNIFDQSPERALFPLCKKHGVAVIARVPFDEGSLTGSFTPDMTFHKKDWRRYYFTPDRLQETCERVAKLQFLVQEDTQTLAQAALKFCLSHEAVTTVIPGMRRAEHVLQNCAASDGKALTKEVLCEIKKHAWQRNFYAFH